MKPAGLSLLAWSMLTCTHPAFAKSSPTTMAATPLGSPGDWVGTGDYPATALRYDMTGVTAFRLAVDSTGMPSRCDIVESSGFDLLDKATCDRVMAKARFSPARDRTGKASDGTYANRVRWVMPLGPRPTVSERFASILLSIDQTGKVTSCRIVLEAPESAENPCEQTQRSLPATVGLEFRGSFQGSTADVELRMADFFTPALRARVLAPMPGYEQRSLNIHHFTVTSDGKIGQCSYQEQRGSELLIADFCGDARRGSYDPPFAAFDKDGVANGWHIMRVLLKTSK